MQSNEYVNNLKDKTITLNCNLNEIERSVPNIYIVLKGCGFDDSLVQAILNSRNNIQKITYATTFFKSKGMLEEFKESYELIITNEDYLSLNLPAHKDNLLLLILLLNDYYLTDHHGEQISNCRFPSNFHSLPYSELPESNREFFKGQEVASVLSLILALENRKDNEPLMMHFNNKNVQIYTVGLFDKIADGLAKALLNSTAVDLGIGMPLIWEYENYIMTGDRRRLIEQISDTQAYKKQSPGPTFNRALCTFTILIRNYIISNVPVSANAFMPNDLLKFLEDILILLKIDYTHHSPKTINSRKHLRRAISDYIKSNKV